MNITNVNAYVFDMHNIYKKKTHNQKPLSRHHFMLRLHMQLTEEHQRLRLAIPSISRKLRNTIQEVLGKTQDTTDTSSQHIQSGPRKYYTFCSYKKKKINSHILYRVSITYLWRTQKKKKICGILKTDLFIDYFMFFKS